MNQWFENDTFWERFAPIMFDEARWAGSKWEAQGVLKLSATGPSSAILDSCCGVGRHVVEFAKLGHKVTGIDRTRSYIEAARELVNAEGLDVELLTGDVRSFIRPEEFQLAVNMFTSFGFFENLNEERIYIDNIYKSLSKGGSFVIDVNGKELLARDFTESEAWEKDGFLIFTEYSIEDSWNTLKNRWMIIDQDGERFEYVFSHRIYSANELSSLLIESGFESVEVFGGFDGKPYNDKAERLIVCAKK